MFNCQNPKRNKLITRPRLGLSNLHDHRFKQNFPDLLNPISNCATDIETTVHYLLHCMNCSHERFVLINNIRNIDNDV